MPINFFTEKNISAYFKHKTTIKSLPISEICGDLICWVIDYIFYLLNVDYIKVYNSNYSEILLLYLHLVNQTICRKNY